MWPAPSGPKGTPQSGADAERVSSGQARRCTRRSPAHKSSGARGQRATWAAENNYGDELVHLFFCVCVSWRGVFRVRARVFACAFGRNGAATPHCLPGEWRWRRATGLRRARGQQREPLATCPPGSGCRSILLASRWRGATNGEIRSVRLESTTL